MDIRLPIGLWLQQLWKHRVILPQWYASATAFMVFSNVSYTRVWEEEFGDAMENGFWQVSKKFPLGLARETASSKGVKVSWDVIHE